MPNLLVAERGPRRHRRPGTPLRMARNVRPAAVRPDQGGSVRFAGWGFSLPGVAAPIGAPWQMAQLAANMTPPACCASREANSPAGGFGAPPSHPEMASEIVNRAMPADGFGSRTILWPRLCISLNNGCDKFIEPVIDGA